MHYWPDPTWGETMVFMIFCFTQYYISSNPVSLYVEEACNHRLSKIGSTCPVRFCLITYLSSGGFIYSRSSWLDGYLNSQDSIIEITLKFYFAYWIYYFKMVSVFIVGWFYQISSLWLYGDLDMPMSVECYLDVYHCTRSTILTCTVWGLIKFQRA